MSGGTKFPNVSQYSKTQAGEWAFDSGLRGKVNIAAVSAGVTVPVSGTLTAEVTGIVSVSLIDDVTWSNTVLTTTSAGTKAVVSAQGSTTSTRVKGFSVWNKSANARGLQLRFGNTSPFWYGGLAAGAAFNWNLIGQNAKSAANKKVVLYIDGSGTAIATVAWEKA